MRTMTILTNSVAPSIPCFVASLFAAALASFVLSRNPRSIVNWSFALATLPLAILGFADGAALLARTPEGFGVWIRVAHGGWALSMPSWLLFSLVFARSNWREFIRRWRIPLSGVYVVFMIFLAAVFLPEFLDVDERARAHGFYPVGTLGFAFHVLLIVVAVVTLANLERTLRDASEPKRWQIKFLLLGSGGLLAYVVYIGSQVLLFRAIQRDFLPLTSLVFIACFTAMAFSLVRHRLLDVDVFVSRYVVYNSITFFVVGAYLVGTGLLVRWIGTVGGPIFIQGFIFFLALMGLSAVGLSAQLRRRVKLWVNRHFFKYKYDYRDRWLEVTDTFHAEVSPDGIARSLSDLLQATLGARAVSVWLWDDTRHGMGLVSGRGLADPEPPPPPPGLLDHLRGKGEPCPVESLRGGETAGIAAEGRGFLEGTHARLLAPLLSGTKLVGIATIGEDMSGTAFGRDDIDLLKAIARHAASQVDNAFLAREVIAAKEAEAFQTLSTFLLHDLKNFTSTLSLIVQNAEQNIENPEFRRDAFRAIGETVEKMKRLGASLSAFSGEFAVHTARGDLNEVVDDTLSRFDGITPIRIDKTLRPLPEVDIDDEGIATVLMNLILNARDAIQGQGEIRVSTEARDGWVVISISDTGAGMSRAFVEQELFVPFRTTKSKGLGIGLFQSRRIVEAHGGRIEVESQEGVGTTFRVILPCQA